MKERKHTLGRKLGYATGDVLGGGAFALIGVLFLNYLVTQQGISAAVGGMIVMFGKVWDAVTDPLMGMISDRTRSRFGRKRIYLLAGVVPIFVAFAMLWTNFGIQSVNARIVYYIVAYIMFSTAFTLVIVPYNGLLADMVDGYKEKAGYTNTRSLFGAVVGVTMAIIPPMLIASGMSYALMGVIYGAIFALPLLITFFTTWENPVAIPVERVGLFGMYKQFISSFKNKTYRQYLGIFIFGQFGGDITTTLMIFWCTDVLLRPMLVSQLGMAAAIVVFPAMFTYMAIANTKGKHKSSIYFVPLAICASAASFFFNSTTPTIIILITYGIYSFGAGANLFVPYSLLPDLADSDEIITGTRNPGMYAGMATFGRKFSSGVGIFVVGLLVDAFGYVESVAGETIVQSAGTLMGIRIMFGLLPMCLGLAAWILARRYKLSKENYSLIRQAVEHKRETGLPIEDPAIIKACEDVSGHKFDTIWAGQADA